MPTDALADTATIARICRYPVKGLAGHDLDHADLAPGAGIPFDRHLAIVSGNRPEIPQPGGWVPSRTFVQNTVYDGLPSIGCRFDPDTRVLCLQRPGEDGLTVPVDDEAALDAAGRRIAGWFPAGPHGSPRLVRQDPEHGFWDYVDTGLSILNLASIRAVGEAAGTALDPRRFRANLYIDGLEPWKEFAWPGRRLSCGGAILEVIRPINRCAAISVDPVSARRQGNVAGDLQRHFGHVYCGVYARVIAGGAIAPGESLEIDLSRPPLPISQPENAPPRRNWPRFATVADIGQTTLDLADPADIDNEIQFDGPTGKIRLHGIDDPRRDWIALPVEPAMHGARPVLRIDTRSPGAAEQIIGSARTGSRMLISGPFASTHREPN